MDPEPQKRPWRPTPKMDPGEPQKNKHETTHKNATKKKPPTHFGEIHPFGDKPLWISKKPQKTKKETEPSVSARAAFLVRLVLGVSVGAELKPRNGTCSLPRLQRPQRSLTVDTLQDQKAWSSSIFALRALASRSEIPHLAVGQK